MESCRLAELLLCSKKNIPYLTNHLTNFYQNYSIGLSFTARESEVDMDDYDFQVT